MKNFLKIIFLSCVTFTGLANALEVDTAWTKTFGGPGEDCGTSVQKTTDNGYIICGQTNSYGAGGYDVWLIKTDSNGTKQWDTTFGGSADDYANSVRQTADNGYVVCGYTWSYGAGNYDAWLVKTDSNGAKQWSKTFGGPAYDYAKSIRQTTDSGYIVSGCTWSYDVDGGDVWVIKTDGNGNKIWDKTFGGSASDVGHSVIQTLDSNYIVCGETNSYGAGVTDAWLIKLDTAGNKLWSKTIGNVNYDITNSILQPASDSGYMISGYTWSYGTGNYDAWLIKTNNNGTKIWDRAYGGPGVDMGMSLIQTLDSGYAICGYTTSYGAGDYDVWLVKTDSTGVKEWDKTFGDTAADVGLSALQNPDSGYVICGWTESCGAGMSDVWLVKTTKPFGIEENYETNKLTLIAQNYPNPFIGSTKFEYSIHKNENMELTIYNLSGQKIITLAKGNKNPGNYNLKWNGKDESGNKVPSGNYFYKLTAGKSGQTKKLTILR